MKDKISFDEWLAQLRRLVPETFCDDITAKDLYKSGYSVYEAAQKITMSPPPKK